MQKFDVLGPPNFGGKGQPKFLTEFYKSEFVTSEDVGSGVVECDPQNISNPRKNCRSFVDATSSES